MSNKPKPLPMRSLAELGLRTDEPTEDEMAFIVDSWTKSYRDSPWAGTITNDQFHAVQRWTINSLVARGANLLVAVPSDPDAPRRVVGFLCSEGDTLHYLYVKAKFRKLGVGIGLMEAAGIWPGPGRFSHRTRHSASLLARGWTYDPVVARAKEYK